jgi:hypothetical protein
MMAGGASPVAEATEPLSQAEVMGFIENAKEQWENPPPIPGWGCDGTHSAGNDERFTGPWYHIHAVCKAFEHYGRVDPSDKWLPEFQCYDGLLMELPTVENSAINCQS